MKHIHVCSKNTKFNNTKNTITWFLQEEHMVLWRGKSLYYDVKNYIVFYFHQRTHESGVRAKTF